MVIIKITLYWNMSSNKRIKLFCAFVFAMSGVCIDAILAQESINLPISFSTFTTLFAVSLVNPDSYTFRNRDGRINYLKSFILITTFSVLVKIIIVIF